MCEQCTRRRNQVRSALRFIRQAYVVTVLTVILGYIITH